eukprot:5016376-Amphidinium_carterae.2
MFQRTPLRTSTKHAGRLHGKQLWHGVTVFVREEFDVHEVYLSLPDRIVTAIKMTRSGETELKETVRAWQQDRREWETYLLQLRKSGKELDPRFFSWQEAERFKTADKKEWRGWIKHGVCRVLSEQEARGVPKSQMMQVPARIIRVNKGSTLDDLQPTHQRPKALHFCIWTTIGSDESLAELACRRWAPGWSARCTICPGGGRQYSEELQHQGMGSSGPEGD